MTNTKATQPELIKEVEELLAKEDLSWFSTSRERQLTGAVRRLVEEVKRLRGLVQHMEFPQGE